MTKLNMPKKSGSATKTKGVSVSRKQLMAAGTYQFQSAGWSSNRANIFGTATDLSADYTPPTRLEIIKRMRYGERNCGMLRQVFNDYVTYTCGADGITPQSHCRDGKKAELYESYFKEWAKLCEISQRFSWADLQRIVTRGALRDGDSFVLKVFDEAGRPRAQIIEAHRVANPDSTVVAPANLLDGVYFDRVGRLAGFSVIQGDGTARRVPATAVCQISEQEWASGSRGVPLMQHSWTSIQNEDELLKLEMLAVRNESDATRVLNKAGGYMPNDMRAELQGQTSGNFENLASRMGGKLIVLEPGEDLKSVDPKRPGSNFVPFMEIVQRSIARGSIPYEFVTDPSKAGGSAIRLIAGKADRNFQRWQTLIIEKLCQPFWAFVIGWGIANGEIPDAEDWNEVSWTTPKRLTVDAGRDAAQERNDLEMGLLSLSEAYAQRGLDFRTEAIKRANDFVFLKELADEKDLPFWMLYKPGFNWLQEGEGKPTAAEVQMEAIEEAEDKAEGEAPESPESEDATASEMETEDESDDENEKPTPL